MGKKSLGKKIMQALLHTKDKTPSGLSTYPLVVLGSNTGGALTHAISKKTHGEVHMLNINVQEPVNAYHLRPLYEQKRLKFDDYIIKSKLAGDAPNCERVLRSATRFPRAKECPRS